METTIAVVKVIIVKLWLLLSNQVLKCFIVIGTYYKVIETQKLRADE